MGRLRADRAIQLAHVFFQRGNHAQAAERYEVVVGMDPTHSEAHFFLASSYDRLYQPMVPGDAENDAFLEQAVDHYLISAELHTDPDLRMQSLGYLADLYGPDRADDPAGAEIVLQTMIRVAPTDPDRYFALAELYEGEGQFAEAARMLERVGALADIDENVFSRMASAYDRIGRLDDSVGALRRAAALTPDNPESYYLIAAFYWRVVTERPGLGNRERYDHLTAGVSELDRALELDPEYREAWVYKDILLRMQARLADADTDRAALFEAAKVASDRVVALRKD